MTGRMADKWKRVRLGDVSKLISGRDLVPEQYNDQNNGIPYITGASNIDDGCVIINRWTTEPVVISNPDDILITCKGTVGLTAFNNFGICHLARQIMAIRADTNIVDKKYLKYAVDGSFLKLLRKARSMIPGVSREDILSLTLPLPPLDEQKRIADVLDKASELIKKRKEQIRLMDELAKSLFIEMFGDPVENPMGWERRLFVDIFSVIYRYPTFYGLEYVPDGFPVVRIGNIPEDGQIFYSSQNYVKITKEDNAKYPRTQLQLYDILMAVRGDGSTAKKIGVVRDPHLIFANISANLILLRENKSIANYSYLFSMLTSKAGQKILDKYVTKTAKKTITSNDLKRISFPLPPLSLQNEFADRIDAIEKQKALLQDGLAKMETAYKALMQEYFG